jgi:predicted GIY-YIG superfamily endonuclease
VTKYLGEIDKVNNTIVAMSSVNPHQASIQINFLHNTKVSSSSYNEQNKQSMQRDKKFPQARSIGMFEIRQQMLGYPTTHTNVTYVSVPTVALEMRRGIKRKLPVDKINNNRLQRELPRAEIPEDLQDDEIGILKQRNLMVLQWRQHKPREIRMIKDIFFSPISEDKMTMFSLRPPELKIVRNVQVYWRMFSRGTVSISNGLLPLYLDVNSTEASCWIDGLAHQIMLRVGAIHMICEYAQSSDFQASNGYEAIFDLFNKIKTEFDCFGIIHDIQETRLRIRNQGSSEARLQKWYEMQSRFVDVSTDKLRLPVVVISNVKPKFPIQFLYHVLLSMGKFDNEFDITIQPTMREAFREAGLLDYNITSSEENQQIQLQQSLDKLLRAYIFEQLLFYPVSTRSFDYYLMFAANIFKSYLLDDNMPILDLPPVLYTAIQKQSDENTQKYIFGIRESVIEATLREMRPLQNEPNFPTKRELLDATVNNRALCRWTGITTEASPTQSPDSFEEQNELQSLLRQKIDTYCAASLYQTKNLLITGAPGCGKTYNLCYCMLYGLSQGLFMMSTALLADRANVMGGIHMHKMCHMAPKKSWTVQMIADNAIRKIICNPLSLALINSIDALCFDELGNISTQLFSAIEIIFRTVRNNNLLFGGVLVIASIDTQQIKTIDGLPVMLSSFIISSFSAFVLRNSVRAADDEHLQRLITLSRLSTDKYKQDPRLLEEVRWIIKDKCTHVSDWSSPEIPISAYRMFGTRNATRLAERNFLSCLTVPSVVRQSDDVELPAESHGEWMVASTSTVGQLNHCVREPEELTLFKFGVYEFTHNKTGCYNQSQLCVLCNVPTRNHVTTWQPFQVIAAPPGTKFVEFAIESQQQLIEKGWKEITVGPAPERQQTLRNNTRGRRKQYGLRHRIAGTSHGAQGATVGVLVTQISLTKHIYRMWERGQIVVSLSRTNLAKNLIFVNEDIEDTLDAICTLLKTRSQFDEYISEILDVITVNPVTLPSAITSTPPNRMLNLQHHAYRPCDVPFPQDTTGFVYLLVSLRNVNVVYIGSTRRPLGTRLNEHNRGIGSKSTSPAALRPWAVLCYVCGFENQESHMQAFEYAWKARRNASNSHNANDIATLPNRQVMADFPSLSLRTVVMGTLPNLM